MDPVHTQLVKELIKHLGIELDLHYSDVELSEGNNDAIRTLQVAAALVTITGEDVPEIYGHIMKRIAMGERQAVEATSDVTTN
jgi:hypothetical protein